jgi:2-polyprenyl-3-methyl-5-hydroxy-6-metoxy-1,4-benzoquinol methylase
VPVAPDRAATLPKPSADYTVRDQERMRQAQNYFQWQARLTEPHVGRRVLEIGCGLGNFTRHLLDRELVVGIDIEPPCIDIWKSSFLGKDAFVMDVTDPEFLDLKRYRPDTVVCLNVLEHIENDRRALEHMHAVLPPGGRALLIVPAFESLYGPIDHNLGHYRRYSKRSFRRLAESVGFNLKARYLNMPGFLGWWVNAKILKKTEQSDSQIRFFDSKIVPVLSRVETMIPPPFGQSIFAILEKREAR